MLSTAHKSRIKDANADGAANADRASYIQAHGAVIADGHAYWIEGQTLWGLSAHRGPGWETCQGVSPWTVAMWEELQRLRPLADGAAVAAAAQQRDAALAERDAALAEVAQLKRVLESAGQQLRGLAAYQGGLVMKWSDRDRLSEVADLLIGPAPETA